MKTLTLTIKGEFFKQIVAGIKKEEYREFKPYFTTKLQGRQYDTVTFINGYNPDSPRVIVQYLGHSIISRIWKGEKEPKQTYVIKLGDIISQSNANFITAKEHNYSYAEIELMRKMIKSFEAATTAKWAAGQIQKHNERKMIVANYQ